MGKHTFVCLATFGPLCWALSSMALAAEPVKVAVINQQLVIERSKAGKRALEDLKAYSATRQKIINSDDQELKELEQTIQETRLSESAKQEKQNQFQAKLEAYQNALSQKPAVAS